MWPTALRSNVGSPQHKYRIAPTRICVVCYTIKPQLLIALTILYAQLDIGITSSCMFNKMRSIRLGENVVMEETQVSKGEVERFITSPYS